MSDGAVIYGETAIRKYQQKIEKIFLVPEACLPVPDTIEAILKADAIVLGPGSLYTSIIPNLLVKGVSKSIAQSPAVKIYVSNIMTEQGETDDFSALDHLRVIMDYAEQPVIDYVVLNTGKIDDLRLERYREEQAVPVTDSYQQIINMGMKVLAQDLVSDTEVAWHDADKLARAIISIIQGEK